LVITNDLGQYMTFFTAGGASGQSIGNLAIVVPLAAVLVLALYIMAKELDVLLFGDEMAVSLGQNRGLYKWLTLVIAVMLSSIAVAMVGSVVFLGLLVPHIVKMIYGNMHKYTIIYTGLFGAIIFALSDMFARVFNEAPVNAVIAMIGLPIFIYIIKKRGAQYAYFIQIDGSGHPGHSRGHYSPCSRYIQPDIAASPGPHGGGRRLECNDSFL